MKKEDSEQQGTPADYQLKSSMVCHNVRLRNSGGSHHQIWQYPRRV